MMNIGMVGAGRMAQALVKGIIRSGFVTADHLCASAHVQDIQHLEEMKRLGCQTTTVNREIAEKSDVVVIAVKPGVVSEVLGDIASAVSPSKLVVSLALGVTIRKIEQLLPKSTRVIRVMPNTPSLVMAGATVFAKGTTATKKDAEFAKKLFSCVGICEEATESCMDAVTGLSGSGPAYIYMIIEALSDGGVKLGIPRDLSIKLAAQTVLGAAKMVLEEKRHPGSLKDDVTSPGGSTIHALHLLEQAGTRALFMSAVEAAAKRAETLGKEAK